MSEWWCYALSASKALFRARKILIQDDDDDDDGDDDDGDELLS